MESALSIYLRPIFNVSSNPYLVGWDVIRDGTQGRAHHRQALTTKLHCSSKKVFLTIKGNSPLLCHFYFSNLIQHWQVASSGTDELPDRRPHLWSRYRAQCAPTNLSSTSPPKNKTLVISQNR